MLLSVLLFVSGCRKNVGALKKKNADSAAVTNEENQIVENTTVKLAADATDTLNPLLTSSYTLQRIMERVYEPLFAVDSEFNTFGVLAEDITVSADGLSADIKLKNGIVWHDNTAFGSNDVVYTIRNILDGMTSRTCTAINAVSKVNSDTVRIYLNRPVINIAAMLDFPIVKYATVMNPDMSYVPVGTGKYRYAGKISVDEHLFVPFEQYHGAIESENFDLTIVNNHDKLVQMFRAGETDAFFALENETVTAANGKVKIINEPSDKMVYVGINYNNPIFWGQNTRQAVSAVINKQSIVSSILFGHGAVADYAVNPSSYICDGLDMTASYSVDNAEELMKKDGWTMTSKGYYSRAVDGKNQDCIIRILTNENETFVKIADFIENELTAFGINCSVQMMPETEYEALINAGYYDLFIGEKSMGKNMDFYELAAFPNVFTYVNENLEKSIKALSTENNISEKNMLYQRCLKILKEDTPFIPLYFKNTEIFYSEAFGE